MRIHQQKQILELLQTLKEAQSAGLYADAQDGAFAVRGFIERIEGKGTETVALLEEYCELLLKESNGEAGGKHLLKHLVKIGNCVRDELKPNRIEVVFISYNASMSDSILSVYLAAKSDPCCDAVWLPVPFYERNADGSLGAIHCEGADRYGDDVDCADWREYDIEARRPDIIITFAPYDEGNYVTSIHPDFYCARLRELTDMLVYIPYFVMADDEMPEHFATVAGCVFAHKVIVQSEKIRGGYVRAFKEAYGNRFGKAEDKFIALGSPKFDAVVNTRRDECKLPDEWTRLIKKLNDDKRKIVLYNVRLTDMSAGIENQLAKLKDVLAYFKARDDVLLWWRPHPLNMECMKSMRPHLMADYAAIVRKYKGESWGIYDDTSDLHRAIAMSDAYYGDPSSVVTLYEATGKPTLIAWLGGTATYSIGEDDDSYWYPGMNGNALYKIDKVDGKLSFIGFPTNENFNSRHLFSKAEVYKNLVYLIPRKYSNISVYNASNNSFHDIELHPIESVFYKWVDVKFNSSVVAGNKLYLIPYSYHALVICDCETGQIEYDNRFTTKLKKIDADSKNEKGGMFLNCRLFGDEIFCLSGSSNTVMIYDIVTREYVIKPLGNPINLYSDICFDGTDYWLYSYSDPYTEGREGVYRWNRSQDVFALITLTKDVVKPMFARKNPLFSCLICFSGMIYVFSMRYPCFCIKIKTKECKIVRHYERNADESIRFLFNYVYADKTSNGFWVHTGFDNQLLIQDGEKMIRFSLTQDISEDILMMFLDKIGNGFCNNGVQKLQTTCGENIMLELKKYLNMEGIN